MLYRWEDGELIRAATVSQMLTGRLFREERGLPWTWDILKKSEASTRLTTRPKRLSGQNHAR